MISPQSFLSKINHVAIYGLKRNGTGYAWEICNSLRSQIRELSVTAVHPQGLSEEGISTVRSAMEISPRPDGAIVVLKPLEAARAIDDAAAAGTGRIWLVMNSATHENVALAGNLGLEVAGGCPLLFIPGTGFPHNLHRGLAQLFKRI